MCELKNKRNEAETKIIEIYEGEKYVKNTRSMDTNERKAKNVSLEICEVQSLFIKQNIQDLFHKRVCFLIGELQSSCKGRKRRE